MFENKIDLIIKYFSFDIKNNDICYTNSKAYLTIEQFVFFVEVYVIIYPQQEL